MKPKSKPWQPYVLSERRGVIDLPARDVPWRPDAADAATASAALALTIALLRGLRDRGVLSKSEIEDLLADASDQLARTGSGLIGRVRASLERDTDE